MLRHIALAAVLSVAVAGFGTERSASANLVTVANISTGIDRSTGLQLANNAPDPDWVIAPGDGLLTGQTPIARSTPIPSIWVPDSASTASRWIAVNTGQGLEGISVPQTGVFYYQTTVDLTGYVPSTASIPSGLLAVDDAITGIQVNGVNVYTPPGGYFATQTMFTPLPMNLGLGSFSAGVNTITFDVYNSSPFTPEALRLEAAVTAQPTVPEPGSFAILFVGSALTALRRARRAVFV